MMPYDLIYVEGNFKFFQLTNKLLNNFFIYNSIDIIMLVLHIEAAVNTTNVYLFVIRQTDIHAVINKNLKM